MHAMFALAARLEKAGKLYEAIALYEQAAARWPDGLEARYIQHQVSRLKAKATVERGPMPAESSQADWAMQPPRLSAGAGRWRQIIGWLAAVVLAICSFVYVSSLSNSQRPASVALAARTPEQTNVERRVAAAPARKVKSGYEASTWDIMQVMLTVLRARMDENGDKAPHVAAAIDKTARVPMPQSKVAPVATPESKTAQAPTPQSRDKTEWTTLRKEISGDYAAAPGGLKKAIELAQRHLRDRRRDPHFGTWGADTLDEYVYVSMPKVWPPPALAGRKLNTPSGHVDSDTFGVAVMTSKGGRTVVLNAKAPNLSAVKKHELTHATVGKGSTHDVIRPAKQVNLWRFRTSIIPFRIENAYWNYAGSYAELDPRIASVKREYVYWTGRHVDTKEEAEKAIQWVKKMYKHPTTANRNVQDDVDLIDVHEGDLRELIKQRMLELVMGKGGLGDASLLTLMSDRALEIADRLSSATA
jgi:hypothetical protein